MARRALLVTQEPVSKDILISDIPRTAELLRQPTSGAKQPRAAAGMTYSERA